VTDQIVVVVVGLMVRHLVESGAEINARNEAGETALFAAARRNHWHTTLYLLLVPTMHAHTHTHTHTHHRIRT
jgi:ankyrin repeat protein